MTGTPHRARKFYWFSDVKSNKVANASECRLAVAVHPDVPGLEKQLVLRAARTGL